MHSAHAYINAASWSQPFYIGRSSDPLVTVYYTDGTAGYSPMTTQYIHIPATAAPALPYPAPGDHHMNFFDLTRPAKFWSYYGCHYVNGKNVSGGLDCYLGTENNVCSNGLTTVQGSSQYDFGIGTIRHYDLAQGAINHMLRASFSQSLLKTGSLNHWNGPYANLPWPAIAEDSTGPAGYTGPILFGSTFGIPSTVDLNKIGLKTQGGMMLARALQNYGAVIRDSGGTNQFTFYAEPQDAHNPLYLQMLSEEYKIRPYLRFLRNQGPHSINGGGRPIVPGPPPIDPAICPNG